MATVRGFSILAAITLAGSMCLSSALAQADDDSGAGGSPPPPPGQRGGGGFEFSPEQFVDRMMQNDANGDGQLSKDEMPGRFADRLIEQADADQNGLLTRDELMQYIQSRPPGGGFGPGAGGVQGAEASFGGFMRQAGRALRGLRRTPFDASSMENDLASIGAIQAALVGAKSHINAQEMAPQAAAKYGADTSSYVRDMHVALIKALRASIDLEEAVLKGDGDAAREARDRLVGARDAGHEAFQPEEDEPGGAGRGEGEGADEGRSRRPDR